MTSYRETYRRHRRLLTMPIVVAVALALWVVAGSPTIYESNTSLWVDTPPPGPSSIDSTDVTVRTPADQQQLVLSELLRTRDFKLAVARTGPLGSYLAAHRGGGWGPSAMLAQLRRQPSRDAQIAAALGPKQVIVTAAGPQVLQISLRAQTPEVAAGTLQALVRTFNSEIQRLASQRGATTVAFYQSQVDAATAALRATKPGTPAADIAAKQLARATRGRDRAASSATASAHVAVIDPPRIPAGPLSGKKKLVMALFGGLFAGALLSLLGIVALTPTRPGHLDDPPANSLRRIDEDRDPFGSEDGERKRSIAQAS